MVVWTGPDLGYRFVVQLGSTNHRLTVSVSAATEPETAAATTATCDFAVRLLATSTEDRAYINGCSGSSVPVSGPSLSRLFQESQDTLRQFALILMNLNEEQIRALASTEPRPDMEVVLHGCGLSGDPGYHAAFVECLLRDRGPTELEDCTIDCHVLAAALEGNSRVTRLCDSVTGAAGMGMIFRSLAENKGLVKLGLAHQSISDENWTILCQSLKRHPTLTSQNLRGTRPGGQLSDEQKAQRTRVVAAMMEENRVLLTIDPERVDRDYQIYMEMIHPYLETNLYRPRVLGIKKADIQIRRPLLGRALQMESVRNKSNLIWMFLTGNQDVVLQSDEEDSGQVVEVAASAPVEIATSATLLVTASAPVEAAVRAQEEGEATP
jgi:hypothetical protein